MRIAIDARELHGKPTGVGRYLSEILAAWKDLPAAAAHEVILCAPGPGEGRGTAWEQLTLPRLVREARADVLFSPGYTGPIFSAVPIVVAMHDVSFAAHPEWFGWKEGLRRRTLARLTARRACSVVTISEFSKREIVEHLGVQPAKIEVIYIAAGRALLRSSSVGGQEGPRDPLLLYVGSLFNRRHLPELIDAFGRLAKRRPGTRLEIVGDDRTNPAIDFAQLITQAGVGDRIRIRSYVSEEELASLYARSRGFVFLSEYEGFGLTPLEALAAGVPIVVLDTPVAREIYGSAAAYVARPDPALIDAALDRVLFDDAERTRILIDATAVLSRYSWRDCAARVLEMLTSCKP
ncbi:MAG: glycosyltransferase family 1 protein [Acidobacteria bacterium]|nr:glycosyltransferase family 1 protein [Acidobacteriota bacterium]